MPSTLRSPDSKPSSNELAIPPGLSPTQRLAWATKAKRLADLRAQADVARQRSTVANWLTPGALAADATGGVELQAAHLDAVDEAITDAVAGRSPRVLITMPPRHGKTRRASQWGSAWFLARHPARRVILASYEADYAATHGRWVRDAIDRYDLGIAVSAKSSAANRWDLDGHDGGMVTAGVGGPITGRGAHLLIIDDPVKNAEAANSPTLRDNAWEWYRSTAYTRLEPGGAVVLIQTRWHEDDLAGRLLEQERDEWRVVNLPALAEPDDLLGRDAGAALWPDRYDAEALESIRASVGAYWWAAMYQQRPAPAEGGLFRAEWFRYWRHENGRYLLGGDAIDPATCYRFATIDLAVSLKTSADWTVIASWAVTRDGDLILLDRVRMRVEEVNHWPAVQRQIERHKLRWIGVESRMFGTTLIYEAGRNRFPVRELKADVDKFTRAMPAAQRLEAGRVWFPETAPWLAEWEHELLAFPNGRHDDQVDVLAYAAREVAVHGRSRLPDSRTEPQTFDERMWALKAKRDRDRRKGARTHDVLGAL